LIVVAPALREEIGIGARRVLGGPFDVLAQVARAADGALDRGDHLLGRLVELDPHVQRRGGDEGVDARAAGVPDRLPGAIDIGVGRARQASDDRAIGVACDLAHRLEIAFGGDREAGLDDVDAHRLELRGDLQLLLEVHRATGRLLAVAQGGVEDQDGIVGHGVTPRPIAVTLVGQNPVRLEARLPGGDHPLGGGAGRAHAQATRLRARKSKQGKAERQRHRRNDAMELRQSPAIFGMSAPLTR